MKVKENENLVFSPIVQPSLGGALNMILFPNAYKGAI